MTLVAFALHRPRHLAAAMVACTALLAAPVSAAVTYAEAYADLSGLPTVQRNDTDFLGGIAQATASIVVPSQDPLFPIEMAGEASSTVGALRVSARARADLPTSGQGAALAQWSDAFAIRAPGHGPGDRGTFSGSVEVGGTLDSVFSGIAYAQSYVAAALKLDTHAGTDAGIVALSGGGRVSNGYDIGVQRSGLTDFFLTFTDVPFLFDQDISTTLMIRVNASSKVFGGAGNMGLGVADYSHTMIWSGIREVRDSAGLRITDYSAVSGSSGYDFAGVGSVSEPDSLALAGAALLLAVRAAWRRFGTRRRARDDRAMHGAVLRPRWVREIPQPSLGRICSLRACAHR